jgi:prolyl oligopeptidase
MIYILTNAGAPNWRIMVADPRRAEPQHWRELIPADHAAVISDFAILGDQDGMPGKLLVARSRDAIGELAVHDLKSGLRLRDVGVPAAGTIGPLVTHAGDSDRVWFSYANCTTKPMVLECQASTGSVTEPAAAGREAAGALTRHSHVGLPADTQRLSCTSVDGTSVQIIAVRPAGSAGPLPTILCVYGGFGVSYQPSYSASTMAWVHAGGSLVIANVRGGGERGEAWHAAGRRHGKQRSIEDVLAAAAYLIEAGYTSPERLAIWGSSHGGLLAAAAVTQQPDYFAAAVCTSPLCDMVRYEMSGRGAIWRSEFGSIENADDFHCLIRYSPYHNIADQTAYPAMLFTTSDQDDRVDALHARKMCAALQAATTAVRPIVLRREHNVGHSGRSFGRTVALTGEALAFLAQHTGMTRPSSSPNEQD